MQVAIPLDRMTVADKLRVLEEVWNDLQRTPEEIPSPAWHADVLHAREGRVREGKSQFCDWSDVKQRIRKQIR